MSMVYSKQKENRCGFIDNERCSSGTTFSFSRLNTRLSAEKVAGYDRF
jgi:hypothetical protein